MSEWTIKTALEWTEGYLADKGDENPRLSAQWLLSETTGLTRTHLFVNFDRPLSADELGVLHDYVKRRGAGEPLQYITGEVTFRHIPVKVRPGVLIPRPETEVLVSEVLAALPAAGKREAQWNVEAAEQEREAVEAVKKAVAEATEALPENQRAAAEGSFDSGLAASAQDDTKGASASHGASESADASRAILSQRGESFSPCQPGQSVEGEESRGLATGPLLVADLCTGSGCIACSLAYEHPAVRVIATDISPDAVALAKENVATLELGDRVAVIECSLGSGIGEKRMGTFDAVVSNPPYVPTSVLASIPREVADFEPTLALDGGEDGLSLFMPLAEWAARALKPGGVLACELFEDHMDAAAAIAQAYGFADIRIVDDLTGRQRVLLARRSSVQL